MLDLVEHLDFWHHQALKGGEDGEDPRRRQNSLQDEEALNPDARVFLNFHFRVHLSHLMSLFFVCWLFALGD